MPRTLIQPEIPPQFNYAHLLTNIWIYALEGYQPFLQDLTHLFQSIDRGELKAVTSEIPLAETLVKPMMNQDLEQQKLYQQIIRNSETLFVVPVKREILLKAARLRASTNLKLPDAIHAATALLTQCSTFLTNDQQFGVVPGLNMVVISQALSS